MGHRQRDDARRQSRQLQQQEYGDILAYFLLSTSFHRRRGAEGNAAAMAAIKIEKNLKVLGLGLGDGAGLCCAQRQCSREQVR